MGADTLLELTASKNGQGVAVVTAELVRELVRWAHLKVCDVTIVGHALGAHVAGWTGRELCECNLKLQAIVGLDPPLSGHVLLKHRLDRSDAHYVQTIRTSSAGHSVCHGHGCFYPNHCPHMPGCKAVECDIARSFEYYAESIWSKVPFQSEQCSHVTEVLLGKCQPSGPDRCMGGEPLDENAKGIYALRTNNKHPFAICK